MKKNIKKNKNFVFNIFIFLYAFVLLYFFKDIIDYLFVLGAIPLLLIPFLFVINIVDFFKSSRIGVKKILIILMVVVEIFCLFLIDPIFLRVKNDFNAKYKKYDSVIKNARYKENNRIKLYDSNKIVSFLYENSYESSSYFIYSKEDEYKIRKEITGIYRMEKLKENWYYISIK